MKKKTSTINFGILPGYAFVSIGGDIDDVIKKEADKGWLYYFKALKQDGLTINFANRTTINGELYSSIFLKNKEDEDWYAVVAHEVFHLCQFLCEAHQVDMIQEKEMVAYLHTHLMKQILHL